MGRKNYNTFIKNQKAQLKRKKKEDKLKKKEERAHTSGSLDDMIAYVDEDGNIVDSPPEETPEKTPQETPTDPTNN